MKEPIVNTTYDYAFYRHVGCTGIVMKKFRKSFGQGGFFWHTYSHCKQQHVNADIGAKLKLINVTVELKRALSILSDYNSKNDIGTFGMAPKIFAISLYKMQPNDGWKMARQAGAYLAKLRNMNLIDCRNILTGGNLIINK